METYVMTHGGRERSLPPCVCYVYIKSLLTVSVVAVKMFEMFFYLLHIMNAAIEKAKVDLLTDHDTFIKGITYRQGYIPPSRIAMITCFLERKQYMKTYNFVGILILYILTPLLLSRRSMNSPGSEISCVLLNFMLPK